MSCIGKRCSNCGTVNGCRFLRSRLFTVIMCDECTVAAPIVDGNGREFRVIAVATDSFSRRTSRDLEVQH